MAPINWVSISALAAMVAILVTVWLFNINQRSKRVDDFEQNFFKLYKNDGCVLECLIPSGIVNLKDNKEIEFALGKLKNRLRMNPLRTWDNDIKGIGYKKFFQRVANGPGPLNKNTVMVFIGAWKNGS